VNKGVALLVEMTRIRTCSNADTQNKRLGREFQMVENTA